MPATPTYGLRYPQASDTADVPRDVGNLANDVERTLGVVTSGVAPSSPVDRQRWMVQMPNGVWWEFVYNAGSSSPYKWEILGGGFADVRVEPYEAALSTNPWYNLASAGPAFTFPWAGEYDCDFGAVCVAPAGTAISFNMALARAAMPNGSNPLLSPTGSSHTARQDLASGQAAVASCQAVIARREDNSPLVGGDSATLRYYATALTGQFGQRWLRVRPRRVSG